MMRRMIFLLSVIALLAIPSAVFAADAPPPIFYVYMDDSDDEGNFVSDLVEIDTQADTLTKMLTVEIEGTTLPASLQEILPDEWAAFQADLKALPADDQPRVLDEMSSNPSLSSVIQLWEVSPRVFLFYREISQCFSSVDPETSEGGPIAPVCYGAIQFSVYESATQAERVVWTLPYHIKREGSYADCYWTWLYENYSGHEVVDQVLIHPTRDLVAVRFWTYDNCPNAAFLIDYTSEMPVVAEIPGVTSVAWSPDGSQMSYVQGYEYGTIDLTTLEHTLLKTSASSHWDNLWIAWPASDTLILAKATSQEGITTQSLVWHNRQTGEETVFTLPAGETLFYSVSLQDKDSGIVIGVGDSGIGYFSHPNVILDDTQGDVISDDVPTPYRPRSRNQEYAFVEDGFIDADGNRYAIDLESYRDRYEANSIRFAAVGVARP